MFQGVKSIVQGADHIARNVICQDAADFQVKEHYGIAVVADGHGSAKYFRSDIGSKKAVAAALETVNAYMEDYDAFSQGIRENSAFVLRKMGEHFMAGWTGAVQDHYDTHPLTEEEAAKVVPGSDNIFTYYGSTVLIAVLAEDYYYGMLIGDGGFVVIDSTGEASIPIEDKNSRANYTSSICSRNAIEALTVFFSEGTPLAMCVSTDGLIKSFGSEEDFRNYHVLLAGMLGNLERCQVSLDRNLQKRTTHGSGDDISISVVMDSERVKNGLDAVKARIEAKKADAAAKAKQAELMKLKAEREAVQRQQMELQKSKDQILQEKRAVEQKLAPLRKRMELLERKKQNLELKQQQSRQNEKRIRDDTQKNEQMQMHFLEKSMQLLQRAGELGEGVLREFPSDEIVELQGSILDELQGFDDEDGNEVTLKLEEPYIENQE